MGQVTMVENSFTGDLSRQGELTEVTVSYTVDDGRTHAWTLYLTEDQATEVTAQFDAWSVNEPELVLGVEPKPTVRTKTIKPSKAKSGGSTASSDLSTEERYYVRRWWEMEHGEEVSARGRLAEDKIQAWRDAGSPVVTEDQLEASKASKGKGLKV